MAQGEVTAGAFQNRTLQQHSLPQLHDSANTLLLGQQNVMGTFVAMPVTWLALVKVQRAGVAPCARGYAYAQHASCTVHKL